MTTSEMTARVEKLETRRFYLSMKDRWNQADFELDRELWMEILELKKALAKG